MDCVRGCTRWGRHVTDCTDEVCKGCQPRHADHGALCAPCHTKLAQWLANGPNSLTYAHDWLSANLGGTRSGDDGRPDRAGEHTPAPLSVAVYDARQQIDDRTSSWLETVCDQHDLTGPDRYEISTACNFLTAWLTRIEDDPDLVGAMWDELRETMSDAHAVAPWRGIDRPCPGVACPECQATALTFYAGDDYVTCRACWTTIDRRGYDRWVYLLAQEAREAEAS